MDATLFRAGIVLAATFSLGAGYAAPGLPVQSMAGSAHSQHFVVTAPTTEFARQVCAAAERYRSELATEWLGQQLPEWRDRCPIHVTVGRELGAGGATSFSFSDGQPFGWQMNIQGSRERILDSVLPHEITHTILATRFGRPLPRWADEGAATSVEHISERSKQQTMLIHFLKNDRGIAFNEMFAMREYPRDILPLYSQGYSLARFLIQRGGRREFVRYVGDGMQWNNWTAATKKHYRFRSLSELQVAWLDWVRQGSPRQTPSPELAEDLRESVSTTTPSPTRSGPSTDGNLAPLPRRVVPRSPSSIPRPTTNIDVARRDNAGGDGWYSRRRDRVLAATSEDERPRESGALHQRMGRPQAPGRARQIILEWQRTGTRQSAGQGTILR